MREDAIEYFGANERLLFRSFVPASPGDGSLSFFGVVFKDARIARVQITAGDTAPGPNDNARRDIVVMDDFIYGEPQRNGVTNVLSTEETATAHQTATGETNGTRAAAPAPLTVNNGSASGNASDTIVTVTANAAPPGQKFAGWTGDIQI